MKTWDEIVELAKVAWAELKKDAGVVDADLAAIIKNVTPVVVSDFNAVFNALLPIATQLILGYASAEFNQWTGGSKAQAVDAALLATAKAQSLSVTKAGVQKVRQDAFTALEQTVPALAPSGS